MNNYTKNQTIIQFGEPFVCFYIIADGTVTAAHESSETTETFELKKGDVIGIFDFGSKEHSFSYTAASNVTAIPYSLTDFTHLPSLFSKEKELGHFLTASMTQCVLRVLGYYQNLTVQQAKLFQYLTMASDHYQKIGAHLGLAVKSLANKEKLQPFSSQQEEPAFWTEQYYKSVKHSLTNKNPLFFSPSFVTGFLARGVEDIHNILYCSETVAQYLSDIGHLLLNDASLDLFDLYTDLIFRAKSAKKDSSALEDYIKKMISVLQSPVYSDQELAQKRIQEYEYELKRDHSYESSASEENLADIEKKLTGSAELILDYAETISDHRREFLEYLQLYKNMEDKNSTEKEADGIRRKLTKLFNTVYTETFQIALNDPTPPTVVMMFLHFGYMDLELAGLENAAYLYSIAKNYQGDPENGIYTLYEWIQKIYKGEKQPSRNELSQDYINYIQTLKSQSKIDAETFDKMQDDTTQKVMYELENMFPVVNKVTNGHFTTFCPIFIQENVVKDLESTLITPYKIKETLNKILSIDFSAFHRSYLFVDEKLGIRENVVIDVKPDFILMPNVGSNGICWQEIEGMHRNTPGRMMISAFHAENLERSMIGMIGDFRWELCRRIQGMRWNDVTEHSLTSEYYDYAMFFNKNRALTQDAKDKIKLALARAKNNYKNLFVMDYCNWILYEARGAVKLNKVTRQIFSMYIPFTAKICEEVSTNGAFTEVMQHYNLKKKQHMHHLRKIVQKCLSQGKPVPEPLENHMKLIDQ